MSAQTPAAILALLERHGVRPRKAYGQHFLADRNLIDKVISLADVVPGDRVVEIGAGTGALTIALVERGAKVVAYEVDEELRPILAETLGGRPVDLRFADVMEVDFDGELEGAPWKMVANLPYNVGTPLLLDVLLHVPRIESLTVMVQTEVADRLIARPGTRTYGLPSIIVGLAGQPVDSFKVPPQVFVPPPQVSSTVLRIDRRPLPEGTMAAVELARRAFGQRRKMLRRSLGDGVPEPAYERAGVSPASRPEDLAPSDFLRLAEAVGGG